MSTAKIKYTYVSYFFIPNKIIMSTTNNIYVRLFTLSHINQDSLMQYKGREKLIFLGI